MIVFETCCGYQGLYCHLGGSPRHNSQILQAHYNNLLDVSLLCANRDFSLFDPEIGLRQEDSEGGKAAQANEEIVTDSDHPEEEVFMTVDEIQDYAAANGCQFIYLFAENSWLFCSRHYQSYLPWQKLDEVFSFEN